MKNKEVVSDWEKTWGEIEPYSGQYIGCDICKHLLYKDFYDEESRQCKAFGSDNKYGGIPAIFYRGGAIDILDHTHPVNGDNGIQFEPLTPDERIEIRKQHLKEYARRHATVMETNEEIEKQISDDVIKWLREHPKTEGS